MPQPFFLALALQAGVLLSATLLLIPGAYGQGTLSVPANSEAKRYGSGWECNRIARRSG